MGDSLVSDDLVLLVGQAPLPANLRLFAPSGLLSVEISISRSTSIISDVLCRDLPPSSEAMLAELLIGREFEAGLESCIAELRDRYFAPTRLTVVQALDAARKQYLQWQQHESSNRSVLSPPAQTEATAPGPSAPRRVGRPRARGRREVAGLLVRLLANSHLLERLDREHVGPLPAAHELRRQALQFYVLVQQLLWSVEAEAELLQPQIEPVEIASLVQRALERSPAVRQRLSVNRRSSTEPAIVRGDPLALEEALVILFNEIAEFAASYGTTTLEIETERRGAEVHLSMALDAQPSGESATALLGDADFREQQLISPDVWESSLGVLAARSLIEHQGGRLWVQDGFPHHHQRLCLALPASGIEQRDFQQPPLAQE